MDDIVNPDGQASMARLGGGGPQTLWGFQLQRRQQARVGLAAGVGPDLPASCLDQLQHYGIDTAGLVPHKHKTPRAWQVGRQRCEACGLQAMHIWAAVDGLI